MRIEPGEHSPTKVQPDRFGLEIEEVLNQNIEVPATPLTAIEMAAESLHDDVLGSYAKNLREGLQQAREKLRQIGKDIVLPPAARALQRRKEIEAIAKETEQGVLRHAQRQREAVSLLEAKLPSRNLPSVGDGIVALYISKIEGGQTNLYELTNGTDQEKAIAAAIAEKYPRALPETERVPLDEVRHSIDRTDGDLVREVDKRREVIDALEDVARKIIHSIETIAPDSIIEEIRRRSPSTGGAA